MLHIATSNGFMDWQKYPKRRKSYFHCTQPPLTEVTKLLCPHHEGAGAPHPFRVGGPDLWYQMTLVDTTVEQSLVSSAGGASG